MIEYVTYYKLRTIMKSISELGRTLWFIAWPIYAYRNMNRDNYSF